MLETPDLDASNTMGSRAMGLPHFLRFLLTGGIAALVNLVSRYLLTPYLGFGTSVLVAYLIGYLIGMATAYVLFRRFVFDRSGRSISSEVFRFVVVNLFAMALVWTVSVGLAHVVFPGIGLAWHAEDIAHAIGVCLPAATSYVGHSLYTFGRRG